MDETLYFVSKLRKGIRSTFRASNTHWYSLHSYLVSGWPTSIGIPTRVIWLTMINCLTWRSQKINPSDAWDWSSSTRWFYRAESKYICNSVPWSLSFILLVFISRRKALKVARPCNTSSTVSQTNYLLSFSLLHFLFVRDVYQCFFWMFATKHQIDHHRRKTLTK